MMGKGWQGARYRQLSRLMLLLTCLVTGIASGAFGQRAAAAQSDAAIPADTQPRYSQADPLFVSDEVLQLKLVANYKALLKDRGEKRGYHAAQLFYNDSTGKEMALTLKVMVRGNRRRDPAVCRFPPLMLNFARKTTPGTPFEHVNKVKLVTHCIGDDYVLREYLVYKAYNVLTDYSFRVRLCQVTYIDSLDKRKPEVRYAFMIEDDKAMAIRNEAKLVPEKAIYRMERTDQRAMSRLALFQYMIGNTDWSVPFRHNIVLVATDSLSPPIPVPFDFDYAGMVATPYAVPPPQLNITSVKERLYRGFTFPEQVQRETLNTFNSYRIPIYAVYRQFAYLGNSSRNHSLKYLDSFYKVINTPRHYDAEITRTAKKNEKAYVVVTGLQ